ncbi:MAG: hypothetical protein IPO81_11700 [Kouleothrix sp.]|nr:hypothetical protein [Kouleothrix sp.]
MAKECALGGKAVALRGVRRAAEPEPERVRAAASGRPALAAEVLAQVQAELAEQRGKNGWGKAWSVKRQREVAAQRA